MLLEKQKMFSGNCLFAFYPSHCQCRTLSSEGKVLFSHLELQEFIAQEVDAFSAVGKMHLLKFYILCYVVFQ